MRPHLTPAALSRGLLVIVVIAYGALLRVDAISGQYDPVARPRWLHHLEAARAGPSVLRPAAMRWDPFPRFEHKDGPPSQYRSDPYTYLQYAREMRSFYAAHRREPLFPLATKIWLWIVHGDDTGVSFASAGFSTLAILLTYLLGTEACSYWVGLAAAALWAIELDVVTTGTEGWRDDAFTCAVLLVAWLLLRFVRQRTTRRAVLLGIAAGAACLVRITALSFLLPVFLWLALTGGGAWRLRIRAVAIAAATMLVVAGPFLFNCWRVFGDPLYAINVHADVYRATEGDAGTPGASAAGYIRTHLRARPVETIDTFVLGLTAYPFANKWTGFDVWAPAAGRVLAALAVAGVFVMLTIAEGRLLFVLLLTSLVPYAVTWRLIADWRFTEHAYPLLLIAACSVPWAIVRAVRHRAGVTTDRAGLRRSVARGAAMLALAAAGWYVFTRVTPRLVFAETLRAGDAATLMAGSRDAAFFGPDWPDVVRTGVVTTRVARGGRATIVVPLSASREYDLLLRVDPSTGPMRAGVAPARITLLLNGRPIVNCDPASSPERVGVCRATLPADGIRDGANRLTLATDPPSGFRVWYLRLRPTR